MAVSSGYLKMAKKTQFSPEQYTDHSSQLDFLNDEVIGKGPLRTGKRVEFVLLKDIFPDPFQPRPQLPYEIAREYAGLKIDCFEAMRRWIELSTRDETSAIKLGRIEELEESVSGSGQINPATGSWQRRGNVQLYFLLETGERRFWATVLKAVRDPDSIENATLEVQSSPTPSRKRQAEENENTEKLGAVGKAREIAGLLLEALGVFPEYAKDYGSPNGYHRQYFQKKYTFSDQIWEDIGKVVKLKRSRMGQILQILTLNDDLLRLAEAYDLSSRELRAIVQMPVDTATERVLQLVEAKKATDPDLDDAPLAAQSVTPDVAKERPHTYNILSYEERAVEKLKSGILTLVKKAGKSNPKPIVAIAESLYQQLEDDVEIRKVIANLKELQTELQKRLDQDLPPQEQKKTSQVPGTK
jgi:hypothetical protein